MVCLSNGRWGNRESLMWTGADERSCSCVTVLCICCSCDNTHFPPREMNKVYSILFYPISSYSSSGKKWVRTSGVLSASRLFVSKPNPAPAEPSSCQAIVVVTMVTASLSWFQVCAFRWCHESLKLAATHKSEKVFSVFWCEDSDVLPWDRDSSCWGC